MDRTIHVVVQTTNSMGGTTTTRKDIPSREEMNKIIDRWFDDPTLEVLEVSIY